MPTKIDRLFALKALEQKITEERKLVEYECRDELIESVKADGSDRRISTYFGPEAGKFSIKRMKGKPPQETVRYDNEDWDEFDAWIKDNFEEAVNFIFQKCSLFCEWWFDRTGEVPAGVNRVVEVMPGTEGSLSAQVYSFKSDIVLAKLAEGGNIFEGANQLLLGDGDD